LIFDDLNLDVSPQMFETGMYEFLWTGVVIPTKDGLNSVNRKIYTAQLGTYQSETDEFYFGALNALEANKFIRELKGRQGGGKGGG
jgi:hypothetical protein